VTTTRADQTLHRISPRCRAASTTSARRSRRRVGGQEQRRLRNSCGAFRADS
jgi:hypothetical protein